MTVITHAHPKASPATERLVREALELHKIALTATEIQHLPSPASAVEKNGKGAPDPTASAAMDERRIAVVDALQRTRAALESLGESVRAATEDIAAALDRWDGK